jgi:hypothetical protein
MFPAAATAGREQADPTALHDRRGFGHYEVIVPDSWDGAIRIDREKSRRKLLQPSNVDVIVVKETRFSCRRSSDLPKLTLGSQV